MLDVYFNFSNDILVTQNYIFFVYCFYYKSTVVFWHNRLIKRTDFASIHLYFQLLCFTSPLFSNWPYPHFIYVFLSDIFILHVLFCSSLYNENKLWNGGKQQFYWVARCSSIDCSSSIILFLSCHGEGFFIFIQFCACSWNEGNKIIKKRLRNVKIIVQRSWLPEQIYFIHNHLYLHLLTLFMAKFIELYEIHEVLLCTFA